MGKIHSTSGCGRQIDQRSTSDDEVFFNFPGEQRIMFNQREIITAIEIGSSKIVVLIGEFSPNQHHSGVTTAEDMVKIIGFGEVAAPDQAVIKGDIVDMKLASEALEEAIRSASQNSGVRILNSSAVAVVFSGCDIASQNYAGHVFINNPELKITRNDIINAIKNAKVQLPIPRNIIHSMDSYHILDKVRKVKQPENQVARELDSMVHIIHGDNCRISNFINLLQSSGFEENVSLV
ncbi:MAG: cell division protein FtsA, partial [Victivallaceae bacterium]